MRTLAEAVQLLPRGVPPGEELPRADLLRAIGWASDVLIRLERMHDRGLFHGEVSPEGIRIGARGASLASPEDVPAPIEYRDPCRARGIVREPGNGRSAHPEHDVYGVGASLFALLEGGPPACGSASALTRPVPDAIAYVVYRAMADGAGRYPDARSMRADLDRLARLAKDRDLGSITREELPSFDGAEYRAPDPLRPYRPKERSRRREILVRTGVLVLLVAGGIATAIRAGAGRAAPGDSSPTASTETTVARDGLPGLVDEWRARIDDRLRAVGERLDPISVPLVLVSDVPVPPDLGWPVHPSRALTRRVRAALDEGVTADEVRKVLLASVEGDTLPAVLWLVPSGEGSVRARLYYSGLAFEATR